MKMVYILQNNFDPTDGTLIVDLPSRYYDYYIGNGDDTTTDGSNSLIDFGSHESMVDSSIYTLYMKWTDSGTGTTYQFWPASLDKTEGETTFGSNSEDTKITATFKSVHTGTKP